VQKDKTSRCIDYLQQHNETETTTDLCKGCCDQNSSKKKPVRRTGSTQTQGAYTINTGSLKITQLMLAAGF